MPSLVRFAFHDCSTHENSAPPGDRGGCHGCSLVPNSLQSNCFNNRGLESIPSEDLISVYQNNCLEDIVSKTDFLHFCTIVGIHEASLLADARGTGVEQDMRDSFLWGRTDCQDQGEAFDSQCGYAARTPTSVIDWDGK